MSLDPTGVVAWAGLALLAVAFLGVVLALATDDRDPSVVLAWLFVILPFPAAYMSFLLFHLVVLGWGAYLLFSRTASKGAAIAGAAALMFSGPVLSLLDVQNNLATLAWIPRTRTSGKRLSPLSGKPALSSSAAAAVGSYGWTVASGFDAQAMAGG